MNATRRAERTVTVDGTKCTGCSQCVDACPEGAISLEAGVATIDAARCTGCLECVGVCPEEAIMVSEVVALAARPEHEVEARRPAPRAAGPLLATLGGLALRYVVERALPAVLQRLSGREPASGPPRADAEKTIADEGALRGGRRHRYRGGREADR